MVNSLWVSSFLFLCTFEFMGTQQTSEVPAAQIFFGRTSLERSLYTTLRMDLFGTGFI